MVIPRPLFGFRHARDRLFFALWMFIILVSVFDGYLVLVNRLYIAVDEKNPVGRALIALNQGDVWLLLAVKLMGTIIASAIVLVVYWRSERHGILVAGGIACFQFALLLYLCT